MLALDDAFEFHERVGAWAARELDFAEILGLRTTDFGELLYFGGMGILLLAAVMAIFRGGSPASRGLAAALAAGLTLFAFFGVVIDMLHIVWRRHPLEPVIATLEDGGEMLAMTLILAIVAAHLAGLRVLIPGLRRR